MPPTPPEPPRILSDNAALLLRLRWVAVVGQLATIAFAHFALHVELPLAPLGAIVILTAITNLAFASWVHRSTVSSDAHELAQSQPVAASVSDGPIASGHLMLAAVLGLDLVALTGLLYFAGGAANPFSIFYLVNLTLCAMLLPEAWGWGLAAVASVGLTFLFIAHVPIPELHRPEPSLPVRSLTQLSLEQWGRLVATIGCGLVIIHFVARITRQLEQAATKLRRVERERSKSEKLEALGTFSAGAAHELATPLSTIAVVSSELVRNLNQQDLPPEVREDAMLIRSEVDHCQMILRRMRASAGQFMAEKIVTINVRDLIQTTLAELVDAKDVRVSIPEGAEKVELILPIDSVAQALRGLLQNALDATQPQPRVTMNVQWNARRVQIIVRDEGPGMSAEASDRAGEPFFTTKEPGRGMGLGLFLTRSVIERLGGKLQLDSTPQGVTACVELNRI